MTKEFFKEKIYASITLLAINLWIYSHIDETTKTQAFSTIITTILWLWFAIVFAEILSHKIYKEEYSTKLKEELKNTLWIISAVWLSIFMIILSYLNIVTLKTAILWAIIASLVQIFAIIIFANYKKTKSIYVNIFCILAQLSVFWVIILLKIWH